jgi:hypothetical protein
MKSVVQLNQIEIVFKHSNCKCKRARSYNAIVILAQKSERTVAYND